MVSPRFRLLFLGLFLCITPHLHAADSAACDAAELQLTQLEQQRQQRQADLDNLQQILDGQVPAPQQLTALLGHPLDSLSTSPAPIPRQVENSDCPALQGDLKAMNRALDALDQQLHALRQQLEALSVDQRRAFSQLAGIHRRLSMADAMAPLPTDAQLARDILIRRINQTWALLPLFDSNPQRALTQLDLLWYGLPELALPPTPTLAWRDLLQARLEIQKQLRTLRADLWQRRTITNQLRDLGGLKQAPTLLRHEAERITRRVVDVLTLIRFDLALPKHTVGYLPLVQNGLALILGIAGFLLLVRLARKTRTWTLSLHESVIRASGERRWLRNVSRLISGVAPMLPWLLLWLMLDQINPWLDNPSTKLLLWLLPLARLYVIYGLISLIGEWLVIRVAQSANAYLSGEQSRQVHDHAHRVTRWLMVPWLPLMIVWESLGPSLLYYLLLTLLLVMVYWVLGRLLAPRRRDYQLCLQAVLPSRLDPLAEALLTPRLFWLFGPLLLPIALLSFVAGFADRVLSDFDWFMRIKARWFRLRTQIGGDEEDTSKSSEQDEEKYERWFAHSLPEGSKTPFIDTGLVTAMEKPIQRWFDDQTDENSLVVVGEKGAGMTVSIGKLEKVLADSCQDLNVIELKVPAKTVDPDSIHQLVGEALDADLQDGPAALVKGDDARTPTLVILDEAQNFFLAREGGLEGWRTVLSLVNARLNNVFWLIMINNQSWAYLCNVFGRDYQFRNVVKVKRWSQTDIRSLILSRNHLSGYQVRYDDVLLSSRGPEAGNVRNAEQRYFSLLWDACRGNPMVALRLWLTSVKPRGKQVIVGLPTPPSAGILDKLGENALFVYAAVATHANLTSREISEVTHLPENVARYALKSGFDAGFLQKSEDGRYRLVPLWYQQVISYLTRKNLLNE